MRQANAGFTLATAAASTNLTAAIPYPTEVSQISATNATASLKYLKLYNLNRVPVPATDVPVLIVPLTPNGFFTTTDFPIPVYFSMGVAFAITGAPANTDTTALVAADVVGLSIMYCTPAA